MSRSEFIALSVLAAVMLLLAGMDPWTSTPTQAQAHLWSDESFDEVVLISVEGDSGKVVLRREPQRDWLVAAPRAGAVDENALARLRASLRMLRGLRTRRVSDSHGLGLGASQLTLESKSGEVTLLRFGAVTSDGRHRWIQMQGNPDATLVEAYLVDEILSSALRLRSTRLLPWNLGDGVGLRLSTPDRWIELHSEEIRWTRAGENTRAAKWDSMRVRTWLDALEDTRELEKPECMDAGVDMIIEQGEHSLRIRPDLCLSRDSWSAVIATMDQPERIVDMHLLPTRRPEHDFRIECGTQSREVRIGEVDQAALWTWWSRLDSSPRALVPSSEIASACTLRGDSWTLVVGRRSDTWVARSRHDALDFELDRHVSELFESIAGLFSSTLLIDHERVFLRRIEISGNGGILLERTGPTGSWRALAGELSSAQATERAEALGAVVGMLQAESFETGIASSIDGSSRQIVVEFDAALADEVVRKSLRLRGSPAACTVVVDGLPPARLRPEDCAVLWSK